MSGARIEVEPLDLGDLEPVQLPVKFGGNKYVLREADADAGAKYRSATTSCARMEDGKVYGMDGIGDIQPLLVSLCLCQTNPHNGELRLDTNGRVVKVDLATVKSWPDRIITRLFDEAIRISPCLNEQDSREKLRQKIAAQQAKLAEMESYDTDKDPLPKNSPNGGTLTTVSPKS